MNEVQVLNKFKAPGNLPQGLSGVEMALWMILVEKGEKRLYGIPVLDALETGAMKSFIAVKLRDENGKEITNAEPISVACLPSGSMPNWWTYSGTIYVGFTDNKIRTYNVDMTPKIAYGTSYYYSLSQLPDGLYYDGTTLYYCSAGPDAIFSINTSTGVETRQKVTVNGVDFDVISRRLSLNGIATDNSTTIFYTTRKYSQDSNGLFSPTAISGNFLCSASQTKIAKRLTGVGQNFIETMPSNVPIWTNEQTTPFQPIGIAEVTDYSVPEDYVVYLSALDGQIYKTRFKDKVAQEKGLNLLASAYRKTSGGAYIADGIATGLGRDQFTDGNDSDTSFHTRRNLFGLTPPTAFLEAYVAHRAQFSKFKRQFNGSSWPLVFDDSPTASSSYTRCTFDAGWNAEQAYENPVLSTHLWTSSYNGLGTGIAESSVSLNVTDTTTKVPTTPFYYAGRYQNEGQTFSSITYGPWSDPAPVGTVDWVSCHNYTIYADKWAFLTDNGFLTVLDQFTGKTNQRGIHIGYKIPYIKIAGQSKDGHLKKTGTTYAKAVESTPTVVTSGGKNVGIQLTGGNYNIFRAYLSFDTAFIDFTPTVIHLVIASTGRPGSAQNDHELLIYEMPAHNELIADHWGSVGRLLLKKHYCALQSIYLPLDLDLSNGVYLELRSSYEEFNQYVATNFFTIQPTEYHLRIFS